MTRLVDCARCGDEFDVDREVPHFLISGERCPQCGGHPVGEIPPEPDEGDSQPADVVEETVVNITVEDGASLELGAEVLEAASEASQLDEG